MSENCTNQNNQNEIGQYLDLGMSIKSMAEEPEEVEDGAQRQQSGNKAPVCVDPEDPNEMDDDCPRIFNMGGNAEMLLNKGVGNCVTCHVIFVERLRDICPKHITQSSKAEVHGFLKCVTIPLHDCEEGE